MGRWVVVVLLFVSVLHCTVCIQAACLHGLLLWHTTMHVMVQSPQHRCLHNTHTVHRTQHRTQKQQYPHTCHTQKNTYKTHTTNRYVFCRQRQDERLRRGAEQKAVVVLSEHAYSSVLRPLSQHVGPLFFNEGVGALQQVRGGGRVACCVCITIYIHAHSNIHITPPPLTHTSNASGV